MAVILQPIVKGKYSGIIHTKDIITGENNKMVIEYEDWRIGAVVNGDDNTNSLTIDKESDEITESPINTKLNEIINEIKKLAIKCEKVLGSPLEIEWVGTDDKVWILQARFLET